MIAAAFLFGVAVGIAFLAACLAWDQPTPQRAARRRREPLGVRQDRLDAEARAALETDGDPR